MKRVWLLFFPLSVLILALAPFVGGNEVSFSAFFQGDLSETGALIFWKIRLPRSCLAWVAGAGLAMAGMVFQALFRNALATPFTLGVSSGASLGAAVGVSLGLSFQFLGFSGITAFALLGALVAITVVYGLTQMKRDCSTGTMLLAGVAVNFFFSSLILLIQYSSNFYDTFRILRWLMGGLQMVGFGAVLQLLPFVAGVFALLLLWTQELNLLTLGEEMAASRGVAVRSMKTTLFILVSVMVGTVVSICGPIGFVGLMCPHICRLLVGADHRRLLPATFFFGGAFLVLCDTVARTLFSPTELPVGIFTNFLGGPFFLWLLLRPQKGSNPVG